MLLSLRRIRLTAVITVRITRASGSSDPEATLKYERLSINQLEVLSCHTHNCPLGAQGQLDAVGIGRFGDKLIFKKRSTQWNVDCSYTIHFVALLSAIVFSI